MKNSSSSTTSANSSSSPLGMKVLACQRLKPWPAAPRSSAPTPPACRKSSAWMHALFDPLDVGAITAKMDQALEDDAFRATLRAARLAAGQAVFVGQIGETGDCSLGVAAEHKSGIQPASLQLAASRDWPLFPPCHQNGPASPITAPNFCRRWRSITISKSWLRRIEIDDSWVNRNCKVRDVSWLRAHACDIDRVVYQVGNSPFHQHMLPLLQEIPGTVVLHDFYLSGLMAWLELHAGVDCAWTEALYLAHGYGAVRERYLDADAARRKYPVNLHVLQHAQGLIVHSEYSRKLARQWYGEDFADTGNVIPLVRSPVKALRQGCARKKLGIEKNDFVVCSFGFLDSTKLNHRLLDSWLEQWTCSQDTVAGSFLSVRITVATMAQVCCKRCATAASAIESALRVSYRWTLSGSI